MSVNRLINVHVKNFVVCIVAWQNGQRCRDSEKSIVVSFPSYLAGF